MLDLLEPYSDGRDMEPGNYAVHMSGVPDLRGSSTVGLNLLVLNRIVLVLNPIVE
jgi:hypothetical protein